MWVKLHLVEHSGGKKAQWWILSHYYNITVKSSTGRKWGANRELARSQWRKFHLNLVFLQTITVKSNSLTGNRSDVCQMYSCFTFSKEYWQLAMTRQNWNTQKSLKQPWLRSTKPRKETRKAMKTATRFSRTSWFLYKPHTSNVYSG